MAREAIFDGNGRCRKCQAMSRIGDCIKNRRQGHAQVCITLDTYSHVLPTMQAEAAGKPDSILATATAATTKPSAAAAG